MVTKIIELDGVGPVTLVKRRGNRSLRLSVTAKGVRVSLPTWTTFGAAHTFAQSHREWIMEEMDKQGRPLLESGQRIGKLHYIRFEQVLNDQPVTTRVTGTEIVVRMRSSETSSNTAVQERAHAACIRALKREAERLLPARLQSLALKHDKTYASVGVKQLKRRWGSCDSRQAITLNIFLMELPWEYIDYVMLHELAHTREMNHGPGFWRVLTAMEPSARQLSTALRHHQPAIGSWPQ